jgi:hypothetical protein
MTYALAEHDISDSFDPYVTGEFSRDHGKLAFNVMLNVNTTNTQAIIWALRDEIHGLNVAELKQLVTAVRRVNQPVAHLFGRDLGMTLQNHDSAIMEARLLVCPAAGIAALTRS